MPYIKIKAYPKDDAIKREVAEKINKIFLETWGCSQEAISLSFEEVSPDKWVDTVEKPEILANKDKMLIVKGERRF